MKMIRDNNKTTPIIPVHKPALNMLAITSQLTFKMHTVNNNGSIVDNLFIIK